MVGSDRLPAAFRPIAGLDCPIYVTADGAPCLALAQGNSPQRALVVSVPKSGTYLLSLLLGRLGLVNTGVLVTQYEFTDNRRVTTAEAPTRQREFTRRLPARDALALQLPGQFSLSHLWHTPENVDMLRGFRLIVSYREARASLVSCMRMWMNDNRGDFTNNDWRNIESDQERMAFFLTHRAEPIIHRLRQHAGWIEAAAVVRVTYEALMGDRGEQVQTDVICRIADHVGLSIAAQDARFVVADCIGRPTVTWSGKRSALRRYWSSLCEQLFADHGGQELNAYLGYDESEVPAWRDE